MFAGVHSAARKGGQPSNSLRALVDRELRARVIDANHGSAEMVRMNVEGSGHTLWVDQAAGYDPEDQSALVGYLLSL